MVVLFGAFVHLSLSGFHGLFGHPFCPFGRQIVNVLRVEMVMRIVIHGPAIRVNFHRSGIINFQWFIDGASQ